MFELAGHLDTYQTVVSLQFKPERQIKDGGKSGSSTSTMATPSAAIVAQGMVVANAGVPGIGRCYGYIGSVRLIWGVCTLKRLTSLLNVGLDSFSKYLDSSHLSCWHYFVHSHYPHLYGPRPVVGLRYLLLYYRPLWP